MKFISLAAVVLVYSFSNWQMSHYRQELRPKLLAKATDELSKAGYPVTVQAVDGMDAELTGAVPEPDDRLKAQAIVDRIEGLRALDKNNYLKVPGRVELKMEPGSGRLQFSGRLGNVETARELVTFLQDLGSVDAVMTDHLVFDAIVVDPAYLESAAFRQVAAAFFELPGNGTLLATESGMQLKGVATAKLEGDWKKAEGEIAKAVRPDVMAAARKMTGAVAGGEQFQVNAEVKLYPSELHVPMHRPEAPLTPERLSVLTEVLRGSEILFPAQSRELQPEQNGKLEQAARAMQAVGSRVRFVVGGFYVAGDGSASQETLARNRAEVVAGALAALGVAPEQMEVASFALPPGSGSPEAPSSQKVEIRVR